MYHSKYHYVWRRYSNISHGSEMVYPPKNRFGYNILSILIAEYKHHHKNILFTGKHRIPRTISHSHH